ncbi:acyl-protein synthase [Erwinia sp. 198]|uniref:LuxE/PaaK family acyltransferase n=1 Tax=Erwinia sp. 198 TaxID=2022746 RepID=UPI000F68507F|nr:acyl-protein synthase [Erwinia sp. 198]RRZ86795.1 acyl-protein synthase [Erwinia sp. 198]
MISVPVVDELCALTHPYQCDAMSEQLFHNAMLEIVSFHVENTPGYAQWLTHHRINPDSPQLGSWGDLPPIFANYFKRHLLLSSRGQDALELTSSGTSGQKSRMRFDDRSIQAAQGMVDHIFRHYEWDTPDVPCNYLLLSYEPLETITLGTAYTDQFLCKYAPAKKVAYALRNTGKGHEFDPFGVIQALQVFAQDDAPVRIFGFPAFMWFVLERMRDMNLPPLTLPPGSLTFFGGGWKTHADKEIPKSVLYARLGEQLGLPDERCRDGYGSVEHCVPYVECAHHHFHIPVYARAWIRDTSTFEIKGYGERGFLQFVSPYITSSPAHSVVMSDLAILHRARECGCGVQTDWFELLGRASQHQARSCALAASELIQGK